MKCRNLFCEQFVGKFDTPKNSNWPKFIFCISCSNSHISINIRRIPTNESPKFKVDGVERKNSSIFLIDVHYFE